MLNFRQTITGKLLRTIIIDDEAPVRESLRELLHASCPNVKVIAEADGVKSGVAAIHAHHPDLLFLDVKMTDGTGFDLLEQVEPAECKIIFVTAYNEFAIQAIKFSALDYLLKPVDTADLIEAVAKAEKVVSKEFKTQYDALVHNIATNDRSKKKIILKTSDNIYLVKVTEILCCESDGGYTILYLQSGEKVIVSTPLKHYQEMLGDQGFFRIHKSFLINLDHILRFEKAEGGYIILTNNLKVPVASRKREELLRLFDIITE